MWKSDCGNFFDTEEEAVKAEQLYYKRKDLKKYFKAALNFSDPGRYGPVPTPEESVTDYIECHWLRLKEIMGE